jgi:hypothetical protein
MLGQHGLATLISAARFAELILAARQRLTTVPIQEAAWLSIP